MYIACWAPNAPPGCSSENFSLGARACWSGYSVLTVCGRYFHHDRAFLTVVNQRNGLVVSFNAVHRYTRLADLVIIDGARSRLLNAWMARILVYLLNQARIVALFFAIRVLSAIAIVVILLRLISGRNPV
jgi:hypothetical protein